MEICLEQGGRLVDIRLQPGGVKPAQGGACFPKKGGFFPLLGVSQGFWPKTLENPVFTPPDPWKPQKTQKMAIF
jgi:hypothetical protein